MPSPAILFALGWFAGAALLPASDPAWPAIERLCSAGLTGEPCPETRPLPRARIVEMVRHARDAGELNAATAAALVQLEREFATDLAPVDVTSAGAHVRAANPRPPLHDLGTGARLGEDRGNEGFVPTHAAARAHLHAVAATGPAAAGLTVAATLHDASDLTHNEPAPVSRVAGIARVTIPEATLSATLAGLTLTAGRTAISWGGGTRGNLLFTDATGGLDLVDLSLTRPWHGLAFRANAIRLEDRRGHPLIFAQRLSWSPTAFATVSAQRGILCCENTAHVSLADAPAILLATHENTPGDRLDFDQIATVSASASLPRAWSAALHGLGARAFYEYGGTDLYGLDDVKRHGNFPHLLVASNEFGAFVAAGPVTATAEYARIGKPRVDWYANDRYPEGWSWEGLGTGHPAGGRGESTLLAATLSLAQGREIGARFLSEDFNRGTAARTHRRRAGLTASTPLPRNTTLRLQIERVEQPGYRGLEGQASLTIER